ncbi:MAG: DUF3644 domain-containing protein, partial [Acidobacteriota bacterium]
MRKPRSRTLYEKAEAAMLSAIEIFNKPDFKYREESFAILALNAWELLLKSKILADGRNDPRCLYVYETRQTKSGALGKKKYVRRNRSGNVHTIGLGEAISKLEQVGVPLEPIVRANLDALTEIRDNAVHFLNPSQKLAKRILEVGTASVKNFITIAKQWLDQDLSHYNLYLMPIGFLSSPGSGTAVVTADEARLLEYIKNLVDGESPTVDLHVALDVELSFKRTGGTGQGVIVTNDPTATPVYLTEEQIRKTYPWTYEELTKRLRKRYTNFKQNQQY